MPEDDKESRDSSRYYQEIAAAFFKHRGGPFLLTAKDMLLIAEWEAAGVPLEVVKEGVASAFESRQRPSGLQGKVRSLSFCRTQVMRAFERHRERRAGAGMTVKSREAKKARMTQAAKRFLAAVPVELPALKEPYEKALDLLSREKVDEGGLERIEESVEALLVEHCPDTDREAVRREVEAEFGTLNEKDAQRVFRLKLVKSLREKYKVPYITFPYY